MANWVEETYRSTAGWDHLEALVDAGHRMAGSDSEREAAELTRDALSRVGARGASLDEFEIRGWSRGSSTITHEASGRTHETFALPRSPEGTVSGELVDLGYGLPEDFAACDVEDAVVVVASNRPADHLRIPHRREKYRLAVEHGAAAFVFRNHVEGCLPRSGSVSAPDSAIGEIPAVAVSKEAGLRLIRRYEGDEVTVDLDAAISDVTSQNVHAELGPDTDDRVVLSAHYDGHDISESAADNAVGTATLVEVVRALAEREAELETRVEIIAFGAEEMGLTGSAYYTGKTDLDTVSVVVQNDGVARERNVRFSTNGFDDLVDLPERVGRALGQPVAVTDDVTLSSDHWRFVERGVPAYLVGSEAASGGGAHGSSSGFILTPADTIDKLDPRDLRSHAIVETELVVGVAGDGWTASRKSPDEIDALLEATGNAAQARAYRHPEYPIE